MSEEKSLSVATIQNEVDLELSNPETLKTLIATTFKGLEGHNVKQAMVEGYLRGFDFKDFLQKNIYAVPFGGGYSLVTSIDYQQKIAMRSGVTGIDAPVFEEKDGNLISCSVTVHRRLPHSETIGDFTATVYFAEYRSEKAIWKQKPRTMIAKVARSHALRMACPEELAQSYVEEEFEKKDAVAEAPAFDVKEYEAKLKAAQTTEELSKTYASFPGKVKAVLFDLKESLKAQYAEKGI